MNEIELNWNNYCSYTTDVLLVNSKLEKNILLFYETLQSTSEF